jgi:hypothetical protein
MLIYAVAERDFKNTQKRENTASHSDSKREKATSKHNVSGYKIPRALNELLAWRQ